jgi:hypothetical protein
LAGLCHIPSNWSRIGRNVSLVFRLLLNRVVIV